MASMKEVGSEVDMGLRKGGERVYNVRPVWAYEIKKEKISGRHVVQSILSHKRVVGYLFIGLFFVLAGCGPRAYKITPVPAEQELEEEVLIDEGGFFPPKIALIDVEGVLMNRSKPELIGEGEHPVSLFVEKLEKAANDSGVKALVVRINSPGGTVTASDLMYKELKYFKERTEGERPVVAVLMDVAASGGYYVACGCDSIVAHPTTLTGSIGVIMQLINFAGTMQKIGMEAEAITSGEMKDAGSPFEHLTTEEREIFQKLVDDFYDRFVEVVAAGREELDEEEVRELADGRVYSAEQALELGFVDRIGTLRDRGGAGQGGDVQAAAGLEAEHLRPAIGWFAAGEFD